MILIWKWNHSILQLHWRTRWYSNVSRAREVTTIRIWVKWVRAKRRNLCIGKYGFWVSAHLMYIGIHIHERYLFMNPCLTISCFGQKHITGEQSHNLQGRHRDECASRLELFGDRAWQQCSFVCLCHESFIIFSSQTHLSHQISLWHRHSEISSTPVWLESYHNFVYCSILIVSY